MFGDQRHWGTGDIIVFVVEDHGSTCPRLTPLLLFISKAHGVAYSHAKFKDVGTIVGETFWIGHKCLL